MLLAPYGIERLFQRIDEMTLRCIRRQKLLSVNFTYDIKTKK